MPWNHRPNSDRQSSFVWGQTQPHNERSKSNLKASRFVLVLDVWPQDDGGASEHQIEDYFRHRACHSSDYWYEPQRGVLLQDTKGTIQLPHIHSKHLYNTTNLRTPSEVHNASRVCRAPPFKLHTQTHPQLSNRDKFLTANSKLNILIHP